MNTRVKQWMYSVVAVAGLAACSDVAPTAVEPEQDAFSPTLSANATTPVRPEFRLFVVQRDGLYEILAQSTGGRFVKGNRACAAVLARGQSCPTGRRVVGRTDRAQRGETVATFVTGAGVADSLGVTVLGNTRGSWARTPLPVFIPQMVSLNPLDDNIGVFVAQGAVRVDRRIPVGTRPSR
jgi:hypothetical protein